jgi:hypothetical protein
MENGDKSINREREEGLGTLRDGVGFQIKGFEEN